jgi:hypothetical protein
MRWYGRIVCTKLRAFISWRAFADDDRIAEVEEARLEVIVRKRDRTHQKDDLHCKCKWGRRKCGNRQ